MIFKTPPLPRLSRALLVIIIACLATIFAGVIFVGAHGDNLKIEAPAITPVSATAKAKITERFGKLPLSFEVNKGQTAAPVKFLSRGLGYQLFLTGNEAVLRMQKPQAKDNDLREGSVLRLKMLDANATPRAEAQDELPGKVNYFKGNDPERWLNNIPTYARVNFKDVYPGVDMVYYGNQGELEYDFAVAPGADPRVIRFVVEGVYKIRLDETGDLLLNLAQGDLRLHKPVVYQLADGRRNEVKGEYIIKGNEIRFRVPSFDSSKPLIIDPVLSYSTFLGSIGNDQAFAIAVDSQGSAYVTGSTQDSNSFPTTPGAFKTSGFTSAFITKLDPTGTNLVYSTYLAGDSTNTRANAIAVDATGNAYITGNTSATDFPVANGLKTTGNFFQTTNSAANWSNINTGLSSDPRMVVVAPNAPATLYVGTFNGPFRSTNSGATWAKTGTVGLSQPNTFALAVDPTNSSIVYGGFTGGLFRSTNAGDNWTNLNVPIGNAAVVCIVFDPVTPSTIYIGATSGVFRSTDSGANWTPLNNFTPIVPGIQVLAIDPTNTATIYAGTFNNGLFKTTNGGGSWTPMNSGMGGFNTASVRAIAIDPSNTSIVYSGHGNSGFGGSINKTVNGGTSWTQLTNGVPTSEVTSIIIDRNNPSTIYSSSNGSGVIKTTNGGTSWTNSSQGLWNGSVFGMAADPVNSAILYAAAMGNTVNDAFITKLNATGSALLLSSYLGGSGNDSGNGIAVDSSGNIYVAGETFSANFPVVNPVQSRPSVTEQCSNAFIAKIDPANPSFVFSTYLGGSKCDGANAIAVDPSGNVYVTGGTASTDFFTANAFQGTRGETFTNDAFVAKFTGTGVLAYSTYLGGNSSDIGFGIASDTAGNAYVTGMTSSSNFPTANPIQATGGVAGDVFVTKLNPQGTALVYSTYLGGSNPDSGRGVAADAAGNAYVTGYTSSSEFPLVAGALRTKSLFFKSLNGGGNWSNDNYGLKASGISVIVPHPTQSATIYIGAANGIFRSTNGGRNWSAINNGLANLVVTAIVIDPTAPLTMYAATNDFFNPGTGVYKSTDGGNSWVLRKTGMGFADVVSLAIDPVSPATLYAGTGSGPMYKTVDGADNWTPINNSPTLVYSISVDPQNHTTVFAAMQGSNGGILRSVDSGATWQFVAQHPPGQCLFVGVSAKTAGLVFASCVGGLFKSTDNGNNWSQSHTERGVVGFDPVNGATLYFVSFQQGVLKSTDAGQTWNSVNTGLPSLNHRAVAVNPVQPSTVYLATGDVAFDYDAFVTKINPTGGAMIYSTLLGGSPVPGGLTDATDQAYGIAVDSEGNAYVTGMARAPGFQVTPTAYQPFNRGFSDAFISKLAMSFAISGHVLENGVSPSFGAEVVLNDGTSLTSVTTESDGSYEFSRLREGGNFTVSAAKPHFTMTPASQTFNNLNSDHVQDFSANTSDSPFYTVSGQITNNGTALPGITVTLSGSQSGVRTTDNNGNYSFELIVGGNYTVTPSGLALTFSPTSQTFNSLSGPQVANFSANQQNFVVTNANDHGTGSLREAMTNANAAPGTDNIVFNIPGSGVKVISLLTALPSITEPVVIDATTQPGYAGTPLIELDGSGAGFNLSGFMITAGGTTIRGFAIGRFNGAGITLTSANNVIQRNYIGIDATGTTIKQNTTGIALSNASGNLIGGTSATARNVVSGNSFAGVSVSGNNNLIQGNFIGTNPTGTAAMPNGNKGVEIVQFSNNLIGGTAPGAGNLISGNFAGVSVQAAGNTVQGNLVGTNAAGTAAIPNNIGIDVHAANVLVGGLTPGARNIISGNLGTGVNIVGNGSTLQGNYVGTDVSGTLPLGNGSTGVIAGDGAVIGGTVPEARNIISANGTTFGQANIQIGFNVNDLNVTVQGNYIGTDVTGTRALGTSVLGIQIQSAPNLIGGTTAGAGNVISGNGIGIRINSTAPQGNTVQGNRIGTNAQGTGPVPNADDGIEILLSPNNTIGGIQDGAANTIAYNNGTGILVSGTGTGNRLRGNSIFSNTGLGIDLTTTSSFSDPNGVTPNDPGDADTGPNTLQNFPVLTSVITGGGNTTIQGNLNSTPNQTFQIDFYSSAALDPSGNGEGALFFNTTSVNTDNNGNAGINVTFPMTLPAGRIITATATNATGNTSEFSAVADGTGAAGSLQFSVSSFFVIEDVGMANVTVVRQGGTSGNLSVEYATENGTAIAGQDYTATSGTLNFSNGETSKTIQVPILDDAVTEQDETFRILLRNGSTPEAIGAPSVETITVQDHNTVLFIAIFDAVPVVEGNAGTSTQAVFNVILSAATGKTVSFNYATDNGTASGGVACGNAGADYESKSGTLTFQPGTASQTIAIKVCGDNNAEANEFFVVNLSNPSNATIELDQGGVTITNDDVLGLILEESGPGVSQAAALSELLVRDPFTLTIPDWITDRTDRRNRVIFFANGLQLNPGEASSAVVVRFIDSNNQLFDAPADDVRSVPGSDFTQVMVKLPSTLAPGTCTITVRAHGRVSNIGTIRIAP